MLIKIKRQRDVDSEPYWQSFACEAGPEMNISDLIDKL